MTNFFVSVATPEGLVYEGEVESLTVPTDSGEITILSNHEALITLLRSGELVARTGQEETSFVVSRGVLEVKSDHNVRVLTDFAERGEDIDLEAAKEAKKRAEEALKEKETLDLEQFACLEAALEKELARLRVGSKNRK